MSNESSFNGSNSSSSSSNICLGMLLTHLYSIEGFIEIITLINSSILGYVLLQAKSVHIHLRLACFSMCFCIMFRAFLRLIMITNYFCCDTFYSVTTQFWFVFTLGMFNVGSHFVELGIVVERIFSIWKTKNYENWFSFFFFFFFFFFFITTVCFVPYLVSFIATVLVIYLKLIGIMPANYIVYASLIIVWGSFFIVLKQRFYSKKTSSYSQTLSERFQYYENIRTNRTMICLCIFCIFHIAVATVFQVIRGIIMGSAPPNEVLYLTKLFECLLHVVYGSCFALFPFTFIFTIPAIKKRYRLRGICSSIDTRVSPQEFVILSVTGKQLFHESTPKIHFMSLQKAWNIEFEKKGS